MFGVNWGPGVRGLNLRDQKRVHDTELDKTFQMTYSTSAIISSMLSIETIGLRLTILTLIYAYVLHILYQKLKKHVSVSIWYKITDRGSQSSESTHVCIWEIISIPKLFSKGICDRVYIGLICEGQTPLVMMSTVGLENFSRVTSKRFFKFQFRIDWLKSI